MANLALNRQFPMWKEDVCCLLKSGCYSWGSSAYQLVREFDKDSLNGFWSNGASPEDVASVIHDERMNRSQQVKSESPRELAIKWGSYSVNGKKVEK